jgi:hypothetical protein
MDPWIGATRRPAHVQVIGRDLWRSSCRGIAGALKSNSLQSEHWRGA